MPTDPKETRSPEQLPEIPQPPGVESGAEPKGARPPDFELPQARFPVEAAPRKSVGAYEAPDYRSSEVSKEESPPGLKKEGARLAGQEAEAQVLAEARDTFLSDAEVSGAEQAIIAALEARRRNPETN